MRPVNGYPEEAVTHVHIHRPRQCRVCGLPLSGEDPAPVRHQYIDLPPIVPEVDETSFGLGHRQKGWLWVMAVPLAMVFVLARSRATEAARRLVGSFRGVLVTDRYGAYNAVAELRQVCWAHLKRDFQSLSERLGRAGRIGKELLVEHGKMFRLWYRVRDDTLSRREFSRRVSPIRRRIHDLLFSGAFVAEANARGGLSEMLKAEEWFWTFVEVEGVEPTNNEAERCFRGAVLWRKGSFGVWSERGARYVERMLTVTGTCRKQGRQVYAYLREAIAAYRRGDKAPSLLPVPEKRAIATKLFKTA
jgi:transposase